MKESNWNRIVVNNGFVFINDDTSIKIDQIVGVEIISPKHKIFYVSIATTSGKNFQFRLNGEEECKEIFKNLSNIITGTSTPYRD